MTKPFEFWSASAAKQNELDKALESVPHARAKLEQREEDQRSHVSHSRMQSERYADGVERKQQIEIQLAEVYRERRSYSPHSDHYKRTRFIRPKAIRVEPCSRALNWIIFGHA